jgi:hypothetical protein
MFIGVFIRYLVLGDDPLSKKFPPHVQIDGLRTNCETEQTILFIIIIIIIMNYTIINYVHGLCGNKMFRTSARCLPYFADNYLCSWWVYKNLFR